MTFSDGPTPDLAAEIGGGPFSDPCVEKFVSFELGDELCCVTASGVAEVVQPFAAAAMPNAPGWLLGLGAHKGEPVAVIDPRIIAEPAAENRGKAKVLIFKDRPDEARFALPVDRLCELISIPASELSENAMNGLPLEIEHNGQPVRFIDHERLFQGLHGGRH